MRITGSVGRNVFCVVSLSVSSPPVTELGTWRFFWAVDVGRPFTLEDTECVDRKRDNKAVFSVLSVAEYVEARERHRSQRRSSAVEKSVARVRDAVLYTSVRAHRCYVCAFASARPRVIGILWILHRDPMLCPDGYIVVSSSWWPVWVRPATRTQTDDSWL